MRTRLLAVLLLGSLFAWILPTHSTQAARMRGGATQTVTVLVGTGRVGVSSGSALMFTPKYVDITAGDTVRFIQNDSLEPHTVTFASSDAQLRKMSDNFLMPVPQKNGPPLLVINAQEMQPTPGTTYDGTGVANSGFMRPGVGSWSLTFTAPGTFHYICLIHGMHMDGYVVVHAPQQGHLYQVQAGDGRAAGNDRTNMTTNDAFYPRHLTIHVGDTVQWMGIFHTVTFGPEALRQQLERALFIPLPQKNGPPLLIFNPKAAYPSGGSTYNGTGFVNSGLLIPHGPSGPPPSYRLTFTRAGTYEYDCLIHPGMDGTITVMP